MSKNVSRIKMGLSRPLSYSEIEFLSDDMAVSVQITDADGVKSPKIPIEETVKPYNLQFQPWNGTHLYKSYDFKLRLSQNQQLYAESEQLKSRELYRAVTVLLEDHFVNIHPTAVRTLREKA